MDKDYFMNAGIPPPQPLHFEATMQIPWSGGLNCNSDQSFLDPNPSSMDQFSHFQSALSSMVSSPAAATTNSALSNEAFMLRELIGKLGGGGDGIVNNSTTFPPSSTAGMAAIHQITIPNLGNSVPLTPPPLPSLFAERAAKFSCFGSRSFNGRTSPIELSNAELARRSANPLLANGKLPRVSSSPALKHGGSPPENVNSGGPHMEIRPGNGVVLLGNSDKKLRKLSASSNEESSVSEQIPSGETASKTSNELNSRKRKVVSRGKSKDDKSTPVKGVEGDYDDNDGNAKRSKPIESGKNETKTEEEAKNDQKPPEPPKDYIHVRARRGQATDSHSLAERVRREKISERMKLLQDLVPGCNKVTGKALMLDEIINYVQSLQRQVEFLSMKLASVNPGLDINMENLLSKDMFQQNTSVPQQLYPLESSAPAFYQQNVQQQIHNTNISSGPLNQQCSVDPLHHNLGIQLPSVDGFSETLSQFPGFSEDDLHSIVQMGFAQSPVNFPVQNQTSNMKVER